MLSLEKMTAEQFDAFFAISTKEYAKEKVRSGNWREDNAQQRAIDALNQLLPYRENTENHYVFSIMKNQNQIGFIWLGKVNDEKGFIYDFFIEEAVRGLGYGKEAMRLIESESKKIGLKKIGLHVFGHNKRAGQIYEELNYQVTNIMMEKEI
ncbi:GNAT family acetyltransferase [Alkalihalobacillus alcalophilus ATCC 27647 = CGMCC 1.3604]|uniref:GNAT family acetyltransferase n=1 Tax=Alkalihalobacillus alcalophilus ATCC 27647 = CGMCC 1.3604 TaxID=1218173 RepID=A0A094WIU7_ALKAL|nr:GNAT family acetyltransferase [Alkalihalobacillus alcalophilus ATCC 27647 = CGMCC 1.3604]